MSIKAQRITFIRSYKHPGKDMDMSSFGNDADGTRVAISPDGGWVCVITKNDKRARIMPRERVEFVEVELADVESWYAGKK